MAEVLPIETPTLGDRSYLVHDGEVAVVIDPQRDTDRITALARQEGVRITHVAETHIHNDYISGGLALSRATGASYLVNGADPVRFARRPVADGDVIQVGPAIRLRVVATPGRVAMGVLPSVYGRPPAAGAALGQAARPVALHRLPRVHHGLQERERGPGRGDPHLRQVGRRRSVPAGQAGVPGHQVQPVRGRAVRGCMPDPGHVPARGRHRRLRQGHLHRLQGLHGRLPVRRDLHQPRRSFGREVQSVRAPAGRRPGARLRHRLPHRGDPRRRPERPRRQGYPGDQPGAGSSPPAGEGHPARRLLQGRAPGHAGPAGRAAAGRRPVRLGHPGRTGSPARHLGTPGPDRVLGGSAAVLRRAAPRPVGLAGQPVHLDQIGRGRRVRGTGRAGLRRAPALGERRRPLGRSGTVPGVPGPHRRPAGRRPEAPGAVLPDLHPASLAQLAGARGVHPGRVRRHRGRLPAGGAGRRDRARQVLAALGLPLAAAAAVYTAYLFAQAKARDLWQSPLLPPHLAVQAALAGAAAMLPLLAWLAPGHAVAADEVVLAAAAAAHLLLVAGEITLPHVTAHARLAAYELSRGRYRRPFGLSLIFIAVAVAAPWIGTWAAPFALAGLLAYEHAYVQAGQSVPLA